MGDDILFIKVPYPNFLGFYEDVSLGYTKLCGLLWSVLLCVHFYICVSSLSPVPAVSVWYDQGIANTGSSQAAAQLVKQAVGQRLQRQHHQKSAEKEAVGGLQKAKESESLSFMTYNLYSSSQTQIIGGDTLQDSYTTQDWHSIIMLGQNMTGPN